ncbi:hypothetical protein KM043_002170 [Ampulex compressa]|nr:hypothetical protein KM043_002170 [Ampulex compressa]
MDFSPGLLVPFNLRDHEELNYDGLPRENGETIADQSGPFGRSRSCVTTDPVLAIPMEGCAGFAAESFVICRQEVPHDRRIRGMSVSYCSRAYSEEIGWCLVMSHTCRRSPLEAS